MEQSFLPKETTVAQSPNAPTGHGTWNLVITWQMSCQFLVLLISTTAVVYIQYMHHRNTYNRFTSFGEELWNCIIQEEIFLQQPSAISANSN